jgi:hypothetical protein
MTRKMLNAWLPSNSRTACLLWTGATVPERVVSAGGPVGRLVFNVGP